MKQIIVIGSGISGLSAAIHAAEVGMHVILVSPYPSERAQSVMAAGGINAVLQSNLEEDSVESHVEDTYKGGCFIDSITDINRLCDSANDMINWLKKCGIVFSQDEHGQVMQRAFGGQSHKRTVFSGASTGKQIVSALVAKCREYECQGIVMRKMQAHFHSALIFQERCYGALLYDETKDMLEAYFADAVVVATGGQNQIFGKTTGSLLCDGYAAGRLFEQGVRLRNLEFIQYHPTSIDTSQKRILITEGARGEGGRLYYEKDGKRVYFMEDIFGEKGNLMPRDVVSKHIYDAPSQVYLDVTFLGEKKIKERLLEVYDLCKRYLNLDITKESIPVSTSVHFFMGGIDVDAFHETNIKGLYAVGECASKYHGANRLGGNSLLAAVYSGKRAIEGIEKKNDGTETTDFSDYVREQNAQLDRMKQSKSRFPVVYIENELASLMQENLGITRTGEKLLNGIETIEFYIKTVEKMAFDKDVSVYKNMRIYSMLLLAKAIMVSALERKESRGSHIREDFPQKSDAFAKTSLAMWDADTKHVEISYRDEK